MSNQPSKHGSTPWGVADHCEEVAPGILSISTPSHGGYWVDLTRLSQIRATFPGLTKTFAGLPWFEEDCDWVYVVLGCPEAFDAGHVEDARRQLALMRKHDAHWGMVAAHE